MTLFYLVSFHVIPSSRKLKKVPAKFLSHLLNGIKLPLQTFFTFVNPGIHVDQRCHRPQARGHRRVRQLAQCVPPHVIRVLPHFCILRRGHLVMITNNIKHIFHTSMLLVLVELSSLVTLVSQNLGKLSKMAAIQTGKT